MNTFEANSKKIKKENDSGLNITRVYCFLITNKLLQLAPASHIDRRRQTGDICKIFISEAVKLSLKPIIEFHLHVIGYNSTM